jgi:glycosyltransferase involved in cell wall biosynthesis
MKSNNTDIMLSVFIICKNEEDRIVNAIQSVRRIADEIIVVDSGSQDSTMKVAKEGGADKVLYNEWYGYGPQKAYAESICKNDWVLNLDADEILSESLIVELKQLFLDIASGKHNDTYAYKLKIKIMPRFSKEAPFFGPKDVVIRLYNKKFASYQQSAIHDSVIVKTGKVKLLKSYVLHNCFRSYRHALEKINYYSDMQAADLYSKNRNPSNLRILFEPIFTFFKSYILNKYIFLGMEGFIEALIYSYSKTLRLAKARELFLKNQKK